MSQKTVLITGATSGIGLAGAEELARRGWHVLVHARNQDRGKYALEQLRAQVPQGSFEVVVGDLSSLQSVAELAREVAAKAPVIDALWNNAGGLGVKFERQESVDGIELQMAVNYLAAFTLTQRLLPQLQAAPAGRIVITSSSSHNSAPRGISEWFSVQPGKYRHMASYGQAKLATVLFTQELARRLAGTTLSVQCFDPGFVRTGFGTGGDPTKWTPFKLVGFLFISPAKGADTGVYLIDEVGPQTKSGNYWQRRKPRAPSPAATAESALSLWNQSEAVVSRILGE